MAEGVTVRGLTRRFGNRTVLSGLDIDIAPGEFVEFRFQARNPDAPGELAFPALQTYDDGEVVEWTGPPDADTPASTVEVGGADGSSGGPDAWSITALSLGLVGTVVGAVALVRGSR